MNKLRIFQRGIKITVWICAVTACCFVIHGLGWATDLVVVVENVKNDQGYLIVSLFSRENRTAFPANSNRSFRITTVPAHEGWQMMTIENVGDGQYAIAVIHDENGNGKRDRNSLKMPEEGFGYSNHPPISFGVPPFDACAFSVTEDKHDVAITLGYP